jgi:hypothetical protein
VTDSEIGQLFGVFYENLAVLKQQVREVHLIALATKDTLANLHPRADEIYEQAYSEHSRVTIKLHSEVIEEWRRLASALKSLK